MQHPNRKISRHKDFDYTSPTRYFITICSNQRKNLFGSIKNGKVILNRIGLIVDDCWRNITNHFSFVELDYYQIMPNHLHGIIIINTHDCRDMACHVPTDKRMFSQPVPGSLSTIIGSFKSAATKKIRTTVNNKIIVWQPRFYDRIIRNEKELYYIRKYINENPLLWELEKDIPENFYI